MQLPKMRDAFPGDLLLSLGLEQEFVDPTDSEGLREIIKRSVLGPAVPATALLFSTDRKTFDIGSAQQITLDPDLTQEQGLALPERQRRFAFQLVNPSHLCG